MSVERVEVLVEEPSMEAAMNKLLPRVLGDVAFRVHAYQCKDELLKRLPDRLRGYAKWLPSTWRIIVVVDRDDDDCVTLKSRLDEMAAEAGLQLGAASDDGQWQVVNRLAIEELEAWYFGDWDAVVAAYPKVNDHIPKQANYRDPDAIAGGTWEAFERIVQRAGYFRGGLRKIEAAQSIAEHWQPDRNRSSSFCVFYRTIQRIIA